MQAKFSVRERLRSFRYAFKGLFHMVSKEHNFIIELCVAILVIALGAIFEINRQEWIWVIFAIAFVLTTETLNSAIERLVDLQQPEFDKKAGLIKDISAGAVLIASIASAIIGLIIFTPKIF